MKIKFQFNVSLQKDAEEKKNTVTVNNSSFVDCARKEILNARERGSFSTAANYDTALRSFLTFIKREDIMLDDITTEMLESYQKWLLRRNVSLNTVSCYMRSLRSIYNRATDSKSRVFSRIFTGSTPHTRGRYAWTTYRGCQRSSCQRDRGLPWHATYSCSASTVRGCRS